MFRTAAAVVVWAALGAPCAAQDWPAFRGPRGDGTSPSASVPLRWSATENVKWKATLPLPSNGSPIVAKDRVFLACTEEAKGRKRALYCFDRETGAKLWSRTVEYGKVMPTHKTNPYCGTTPATDGEIVVVWHGSAGLFCYDFAGEEQWKLELGEFRHRWGYGTSPILHDGKVILHAGPGPRVSILAIDAGNGEVVWKKEEPVDGDGQDNAEGRLMGSWCTPIVARVAGADQIICVMSTRVVAYAPADGRVLWWSSGLSCQRGDLAYSSPVVAGDICHVVGGYDGPGLGIRLGGSGDVTDSHRVWRLPKRPSNCGSGVVVDGYTYLPDIRGVLVCVDPKTGKRVWQERAVKGPMWGSVVYAGGHLYVMNQRGVTVVFKPNPKKLEVVATNALGESTNATPAIAGGEIFLRTHKHLYCIAASRKQAR